MPEGEGTRSPLAEGKGVRTVRNVIADLVAASTDPALAAEAAALLADTDRLPLWLDDRASGDEIELAREEHGCWRGDPVIEVDDDARVSHGDKGCWVQGWLWVPGVETEEEC